MESKELLSETINKYLASHLEGNKIIQHYALPRQAVPAAEIPEMMEIVKQNCQNEHKPIDIGISIPDSGIKSAGCFQIAKIQLNNIVYLNLYANQIDNKGCYWLARGLGVNLQYLFLTQNYINDEGCQYIAKARWKNLKQLGLAQNRVTVIGCKTLSKIDAGRLSIWLNDSNIDGADCMFLRAKKWKLYITGSENYEYDEEYGENEEAQSA